MADTYTIASFAIIITTTTISTMVQKIEDKTRALNQINLTVSIQQGSSILY